MSLKSEKDNSNTNDNTLTQIINILEKSKERLNWNEYFMSLAFLASQRSACERLKVGCVLVSNNRIVCMGYNGFLPNSPHVSRVRNNHEQGTVHAEQNAIADAANRGAKVEHSSAYITHYPCINCFKILAASGVKNIYYKKNYKNDELVKELSIENGIKLLQL
jgi:dCMP deaminase